MGKDARLRPGVASSPAVPGSGLLRPRRPAPDRKRRLYCSLNGLLGRLNSQHDVPQYLCVINTPFSALISRLAIDTRSVSPVNSGRRTMMAFGGIRRSVQGRKCPESAEHRRFATAPDVVTAGSPTNDIEAPPAVIVPVGEFSMRRERVPSGSPVRAPGRANGECEPGIGRFVVAYINSCLTSAITQR